MAKISQYPNGFGSGLTIREQRLIENAPGKVFWVGNNATLLSGEATAADTNLNNRGGTFLHPFSTVDYAIGQCAASRGDIIFVRPGYSESVTSTSTTLDVAGVSIIGMGVGANRPLFNFGVTTSTITVSANNCSIENIQVKATVDSVVAGFTVSGAGCRFDIESLDGSASIEFISVFVTAATADNLQIKARHRGYAAGDAMTRYIDLVGCRDATIDVDFFGIASVAVVNMRTTACDNVKVYGSFYNDSAALTKNVVNSTTSTWSVRGYDAKAGYDFMGSDDIAVAPAGPVAAMPMALESSISTVASGNNLLFTISGGPIKVLEIVGIGTTILQAQATSCKLTTTTVAPAATVDMSAGAIDLTGLAAGSSIRHINTTAVLTPVTAGYVMEGNAFATQDTQFLVPIGTIQLNNASATNTGAIKWYLRYVPLSQNSRVVG